MVLWQGWLYILEPGAEPRRITGDEQRPTLGGGPGAARQPDILWNPGPDTSAGSDTNPGPDTSAGGSIVFLGERRGESYIYEVSADGGDPRQLWGGGRLAGGMSLDGYARRSAVVSSSPSAPSELHLADLSSGESLLSVDPNSGYVEKHTSPSLSKFSISRAGFDVEARLWFPPDFDSAASYPLVLDIHGGPNGAFYDSFVPWQQALASSGYLVLAVNPRGSSPTATPT